MTQAGDIEGLFEFVVPEFVDVHCHGGGGAYFWENAKRARDFHRENGTGIQVASIVTLEIEKLRLAIRHLVDADDIFGIHLEGPYISRQFCGAHNAELLRIPKISELESLLEIAKGKIVMVTIAPELENALEAIKFLVKEGDVVAIGHSAADAAITQAAIQAGAKVVTHFNNAMEKLGSTNSLNSESLHSNLLLELIPDSLHVPDSDMRKIIMTAPERCLAITDAISAAGSPDGRYTIGSLDVEVKNGEARLSDSGRLAGSTLTMLDAFLNIKRNFGIEKAIELTSEIPRRMLGITSPTRYIRISGRKVTFLER